MTFSVELVVAIFAGLVSLTTAIGAVIIAIYNGKVSREDSVKKDQKLQEIHVMVNSNLDSAKKEIEDLKRQVTSLITNPAKL